MPPSETETDTDEDTLMELDMSYTREEFIKMALSGALHAYIKFLPVYCGISVFIGLLFGLTMNFGVGIVSFLLLEGLFFAFMMVSARGQASKIFGNMPDGGSRLHIRFTDWGLIMRSYQEGKAVKLAWSIITRAVERPDCVEFYTKTSLLNIPKRCITDMSELRTIVDTHHSSHSKKKA